MVRYFFCIISTIRKQTHLLNTFIVAATCFATYNKPALTAMTSFSGVHALPLCGVSCQLQSAVLLLDHTVRLIRTPDVQSVFFLSPILNMSIFWSASRSPERVVGRSPSRSVGRSVGRSVCRSVGRSLGRSVARSVARSFPSCLPACPVFLE